jgi:hypothetical protein
VIARRKLPDGPWESTELDYDLYSDDSHNTVSLAVTPSDGRIHIAFPTHANAIRYTRSVSGVADTPEGVQWSSRLFEATKTTFPGAPAAPVTFSYPQFEQVQGQTLLTYRDGSTDNGRQVLLRYNNDPDGTWSFLGRFTSNAGVYQSPYGTSTSRYAYLHGFTASPTGELAITMTWREQGSAWCASGAVGNHDLGYAVSPDGGMTWLNNAGETIGRIDPAAGMISVHSPGVVVRDIPINVGMINQETQAFDSKGRLHVVTSRVPDEDLPEDGCVANFYAQRAMLARPYHHWRDADGTWHTMQLPVRSNSSGRTKIVFDSNDVAYVILPDARIIASTAASEWRDWQTVFEAEEIDNVSELTVDRQRLQWDGVLSVVYQERATQSNAPSAYRVADFSLSPALLPVPQHQPKSTVPEAAPASFAGSADG